MAIGCGHVGRVAIFSLNPMRSSDVCFKVGGGGGDYSTERNDGLNHGTERFLKLKLATYHC